MWRKVVIATGLDTCQGLERKKVGKTGHGKLLSPSKVVNEVIRSQIGIGNCYYCHLFICFLCHFISEIAGLHMGFCFQFQKEYDLFLQVAPVRSACREDGPLSIGYAGFFLHSLHPIHPLHLLQGKKKKTQLESSPVSLKVVIGPKATTLIPYNN